MDVRGGVPESRLGMSLRVYRANRGEGRVIGGHLGGKKFRVFINRVEYVCSCTNVHFLVRLEVSQQQFPCGCAPGSTVSAFQLTRFTAVFVKLGFNLEFRSGKVMRCLFSTFILS
jgi:hypothetical protein